tara:strand:+ start:205 stop:513 length:309 start_codon:yes stop_codon:yes gene_type:complete
MGSKEIIEKWKDILRDIDDDYAHHNMYKLLESIKDYVNINYEKEKDYNKKHNIIKNSWYCDTLKEYIYFLEKNLSDSIKKIKKLEEGFDERNKIFNLYNEFK